MKIGILTYVHSKNFGANLQCFALLKVLEALEYNVEVINHYRPIDIGYLKCKSEKERFPILYSYNSSKDIKAKINKKILRFVDFVRHLFYKNEEREINEIYMSFYKTHLNFSKETYWNFTQLYENFNNNYSHIIVGSDQVWNYASDFSKEPYFLTFVHNAKKISYAASVGHAEIPIVIQDLYKKWLSDFSSISVREESGRKLLERLTETPIHVVLDPTLLLNKKQWKELLSVKSTNDGKHGYVLVYMLSLSKTVIESAKYIAKTKKLDVKIISYKNNQVIKNKSVDYLQNKGPQNFVELMLNASYVVTNSYHGTAFAINFNIPFVTVVKKNKRVNSRIEDLLNLVHLKNRIVFENDLSSLSNLNSSCSFSETNMILESERKNSINYLISSLS